MKNDLTFRRTSLSTSADVVNTLEFKMESLQEQGLLVQEGIADYIGLSLNEIDAQLLQLKSVKQEVSEREKALKSQSTLIKEDGVLFLEKFGTEKLEGNIVSSVTIAKGKKASTKQEFKVLCTKEEMQNFLIDKGLGIMIDKEVPATKSKLRVNKRKIALAEVEDA